MAVSQCRQNYHSESEGSINRQINLELYASYTYQSMVSHACVKRRGTRTRASAFFLELLCIILVAISSARFTNKQLLAGKVALEIILSRLDRLCAG